MWRIVAWIAVGWSVLAAITIILFFNWERRVRMSGVYPPASLTAQRIAPLTCDGIPCTNLAGGGDAAASSFVAEHARLRARFVALYSDGMLYQPAAMDELKIIAKMLVQLEEAMRAAGISWDDATFTSKGKDQA